ncbi:TetR/AcrR family transcriptional regulator [Roseinatronobacter alkalisoli]|uniref:TetR/AcrR family transcriptional regulator n=1 Tax=Roseinatronobacter alkalisoli TaxID=3028235 RepID=A0ABT5T3E4_9RHOB|nr:TetR/AcrR family transcriptional regulator [Roseinatronobacter sp. HJB301]MDD7969644.1 TetR/AcrR family transcriptional regulator [Roseinatronobacter sp. HJB301]
MKIFWAEGFDGASVDLLARETGMPRATLYQVYADKEGLFLAAVAHYAGTRTARVGAALRQGGNLRDDLAAFFSAVIELATSEPKARGCLISCVLADAAGTNPRFRAELERRFLALENRIRERLEAAGPEAGDIPARAVMIAAIARGLMLRARAGAGRDFLEQAAAEAVRVLAPPRH